MTPGTLTLLFMALLLLAIGLGIYHYPKSPPEA